MKDPDSLDDRSLRIIKSIVDEYVRSGDPIGSANLAKKGGIELSPASVRNVMANLEKNGYIEPIHTSSGRRPTTKGLRVYLGSLVRMRTPSEKEREEISGQIRTDSTNGMAKSAMRSVSGLTKMISLVTIPSRIESKLKRMHFVELSSNRLMVVMVTMEGEVSNRLVGIDDPLGPEELRMAEDIFNEKFAGHSLTTAKIELRGLVSGLKEKIAVLLSKMLKSITDGENAERGVYVSGSENLIANREMLHDADSLSDMVDLLQRKETLLKMLEKGSRSQDVSVFIGNESGVPELTECSLVTSPYENEHGEVVGVLGLIGPRRMEYGTIVPLVELTSDIMTETVARIHKDLN